MILLAKWMLISFLEIMWYYVVETPACVENVWNIFEQTEISWKRIERLSPQEQNITRTVGHTPELQKKLPQSFWAGANATPAYMPVEEFVRRNFEQWLGRKPNVSFSKKTYEKLQKSRSIYLSSINVRGDGTRWTFSRMLVALKNN